MATTPKTMIDLVLVRHGETFWNVDRRFQGHGGGGLNDTGRAQAREVAALLVQRYPTCSLAYSSDLLRVRETWQPWAIASGIEVAQRPDLREIDLGQWTGLYPADVNERFPDTAAAIQRGEDPPRGGGESWTDVRARVTSALRRIAGEASGRLTPTDAAPVPVLVFTHGGPIRVVTAEFLGLPPLAHRWLAPAQNCSVTTIRLDSDGHGTVLGYNQPGSSHADISLFG